MVFYAYFRGFRRDKLRACDNFGVRVVVCAFPCGCACRGVMMRMWFTLHGQLRWWHLMQSPPYFVPVRLYEP